MGKGLIYVTNRIKGSGTEVCLLYIFVSISNHFL